MSLRHNRQGFTIIELMVATLVFTVIMTTVAAVIVSFANTQRRSMNETTTQNAARSVMDQVVQTLQFEARPGQVVQLPNNGDGSQGYCIGGTTTFSFIPGRLAGGGNRAAIVERGQSCGATASPVTSTTSGSDLVGENMRIVNFTINEVAGTSGVYRVTLRVIYGIDDVLCSPSTTNDCASSTPISVANARKADVTCKTTKNNLEHCAVSELSTTVRSRL